MIVVFVFIEERRFLALLFYEFGEESYVYILERYQWHF